MLPSPGFVAIRPTREDAEQYKDAFYTLIDAIQGKLTYKQLAAAVDPDALDNVSSVFRSLNARTLNPSGRTSVLRYIFDKAQLFTGKGRAVVRNVPDAAYFALLEFLSIPEAQQDAARARLVGTYRFWRFSMEHPGEYVLGRLCIEEDAATHALRASMLQVRLLREGHVGGRQEFTGYVLRVANMDLLILRSARTNAVRTILLNHCQTSDVGTDHNPRSPFRGCALHVISLDGHELGIDGSKAFHSPVHLALVDNVDELAGLEASLDVVGEGDPRLPRRVIRKLQAAGEIRRL